MILYRLRCNDDHEFEGWFRNADAFDAQRAAGSLECPVCGSAKVEKALMAPRVATGDDKPSLTAPRSEAEAALEKLRRHVEANSDYVGLSFAEEARAMHEGRSPTRSIHGV